jgi:hypothetical protein
MPIRREAALRLAEALVPKFINSPRVCSSVARHIMTAVRIDEQRAAMEQRQGLHNAREDTAGGRSIYGSIFDIEHESAQPK